MKKVLILFIAVFSFYSATAEKPKVLASCSMLYDMAKQIGGDVVDVDMIVPIGGDPHLHEPTPRDAKIVGEADLILLNGLTFEGWIDKLVENSGTDADVVTVTKGVNVIASEAYKNAADPHAWMDASNGVVYSKNIMDALVKLVPGEKAKLEASAQKYMKQLEELDRYITEQINTIPEKKRVLITSHDAFAYYGKKYGIRLEAIMGISTEADVQTSDIMRVSKMIKENAIPAVFVESTINPKLMNQISKDTGVKIGGKLFADSLGDATSGASTYIDMLKQNTDVIVKALTGTLGESYVDPYESDNNDGKSNLLLYGVLAGLLLLVMTFMLKKMSS